MSSNPIFKTDSYKLTHWKQYPKGTTKIYSYLESRGGAFPATIFFGLQYILKKYMTTQVTQEHVDFAADFTERHIGKNQFNYKGWSHIVKAHNGFAPLEIKAVPEGSLVKVKNVLATIENLDDECWWLTNVKEGLKQKVWSPITVATNSFFCKNKLIESARKTGSPIAAVDFKLHDFGYRGTSSEETAAIAGAAHLTSFQGSDNLAAIEMIWDYYGWDRYAKEVPAYSVPASEHSTATPYGKGDGEKIYLLNMLEQYPEGIVSVIADSFDVFGFCEMAGTDPEIREKILSRPGTVVLRLDSGDPVEVVLKCLSILWSRFGGTFTDTHYKLLNSKVRILQGDGIDRESIGRILTAMENDKFASDNIVFGSGGGLLQKFDRDTCQFAIKCSSAIINGKEVNVQKDPITGSGKKSKQGRLKLQNGLTYSSADTDPINFNALVDELQPVFRNGKVLREFTLPEIRERVNNYLL